MPYFFSFFLLINSVLFAEKFEFRYHSGEKYRFLGQSHQIVLFNGKELQKNHDTYKINYQVESLDHGRGKLSGKTLYISHRENSFQASQIDREYETLFIRDRWGEYEIDSQKILPVVRGIPRFLDRDVKVGDTWSYAAEELQDLSSIQAFNTEGPLPVFRIPLQVSYKYVGKEEKNGVVYDMILADYIFFFRTDVQHRHLYPVFLKGSSHQKIYFNLEKGRVDGYQEDYSLALTLNTGDVYEFTGQAHAKLIEAVEMDKPEVERQIKKQLENHGLGDIDVRSNDEGVVLNLDSVQFPADSALLLPSEKEKMNLIGEILRQYPNADILVEGHTALAGGEKDAQKLSQERAAAVSDFLVALGVRTPERIIFRGWGSTRPLASNDTEENKQKNRRVEITILEN